jgi:hypothetical protein
VGIAGHRDLPHGEVTRGVRGSNERAIAGVQVQLECERSVWADEERLMMGEGAKGGVVALCSVAGSPHFFKLGRPADGRSCRLKLPNRKPFNNFILVHIHSILCHLPNPLFRHPICDRGSRARRPIVGSFVPDRPLFVFRDQAQHDQNSNTTPFSPSFS